MNKKHKFLGKFGMAELVDFELKSTHGLLVWAFRAVAANMWAMGVGGMGGGGRCDQLTRQLEQSEACVIVSCVDKLPRVQRDLLYFFYSQQVDSELDAEFNFLHNWAWEQCLCELECGEAVKARLGLARVFIPLALRDKTFGRKCRFTYAGLARFVGVSAQAFGQNYKRVWLCALAALDAERSKAFEAVDDYVVTVLQRRDDGPVTAELAAYFRAMEARVA